MRWWIQAFPKGLVYITARTWILFADSNLCVLIVRLISYLPINIHWGNIVWSGVPKFFNYNSIYTLSKLFVYNIVIDLLLLIEWLSNNLLLSLFYGFLKIPPISSKHVIHMESLINLCLLVLEFTLTIQNKLTQFTDFCNWNFSVSNIHSFIFVYLDSSFAFH